MPDTVTPVGMSMEIDLFPVNATTIPAARWIVRGSLARYLLAGRGAAARRVAA